MSADDRAADRDEVESAVPMIPGPRAQSATLELAPSALSPADLEAQLTRHFGHARFRPGQEQIVRSVLEGRPTIAILPTGGGKSLCYQLPALLLEGTSVVVSPLLALMKDQVDQLNARGVAATLINSSLSEAERRERQEKLRRGEWKIVYVAPERFRSRSFLSALAQVRVPLLAIDEAHCISSWGHDFRPDYARLQEAHGEIRAERILALTATATPEVRKDIADALALREPRVFVAGFDRPNLFLEVVRASGDGDKLARLAALARSTSPGIVYAATRRNVEKVVAALRERGLDAVGYHAGMDDASRVRAQEQFVEGRCEVIVATNAFGMGVDKADTRFVAHFDVPRTVEAWYQEIGRAGRDGNPSQALLLFNFADVMLQRRLIDGARASESAVRAALAGARRLRMGSLDALSRASGLSVQELQPAIRVLESAGHLERGRGRGDGADFALASSNGPDDESDELGIDFAMLERRVQRERRMLDRMVRLADATGCRRQELLRYFGDPQAPARCAACDNCAGPRAPGPDASDLRARSRTRKSSAPDPQRAAAESEVPIDPLLFEALRALRTQLARAANAPAYVIFPDATLRELCLLRPTTRDQFLLVKGAGPARWEKYGEQFLEVIRSSPAPAASRPAPGPRADAAPKTLSDAVSAAPRAPGQPSATRDADLFSANRSTSPSRTQPRQPPPRASDEMPSWLDSPPSDDLRQPVLFTRDAPPRESALGSRALALARSGSALTEIASKLGQDPAEIASELARLASLGERLDVPRLLGPERYAAIRAAGAGSEGNLVAIKRRLPFPAVLGEIRLALM